MQGIEKCWRCETSCSQRCGRCTVAYYCSKKCQKQDWGRHKVDCDAAAIFKVCSACGKKVESKNHQCTNCMEAWYCGKQCQKNNWPEHKSKCQMNTEKIVVLTVKLDRFYSIKMDSPGLCVTYYWGNLPAVDLINLPMNEGASYSKPLSLLLCGVGDPRNVLLSIASLPDTFQETVNFVLNDICSCTLARTVLLIYMLSKAALNMDIARAIIQIWYSLRLSEHDFGLLMSALEELSTATNLCSLTRGLMQIDSNHLEKVKKVWQVWRSHSSRSPSDVIAMQREQMFAADAGAKDGKINYVNGLSAEHRSSANEWLQSGVMLPIELCRNLTRENPTLTGFGFQFTSGIPQPFKYLIPSDVLPFTGWDYFAVKKYFHDASLQKMYNTYITNVLVKCAPRLMKDKVQFHIVLTGCLDIAPFLPADLRYDRITTSNLWDYIPLTTLLMKFKSFLNPENHHSVMVTETSDWCRNFMPEIFEETQMQLSQKGHLAQVALKDTHDPGLVFSSGMTTFVEYQDLTGQFVVYLRAALLGTTSNAEIETLTRVPSLSTTAQKHGLQLRNFLRNENSVFPFRWAMNCRRATMLRGFERALEWINGPAPSGVASHP